MYMLHHKIYYIIINTWSSFRKSSFWWKVNGMFREIEFWGFRVFFVQNFKIHDSAFPRSNETFWNELFNEESVKRLKPIWRFIALWKLQAFFWMIKRISYFEVANSKTSKISKLKLFAKIVSGFQPFSAVN